jgi:large subunit ribosomal protein L9
MEIILKEDVPKLGSRGDVVKVADGYGRNYLLPRKLAIEASAANQAVIGQMKAAAVRRVQRDKAEADSLARQLEGVSLTLQRLSGEHNQLFGSVTSSDIAAELEKKGFNLDRRKIQLDEPIKTLGQFQIPIRIFREVTANVRLTVEAQPSVE